MTDTKLRRTDAASILERYGYDVVDLETLRWALVEAARDMHETLMRGGFSPLVRDIRDCTAAVHMRTDKGWEMVATWEGCVQHAFTSQHIVNFAMSEWDEASLKDGDVILVNDPWRGAIHCSDLNLIRPVIIDGRIDFVLHATAHVADLGGAIPGGFANGTRTCFEENLKFPPTLLFAEGVPVRPIFNYLLENNRVPHLLLGDLRALSGSLEVGSRRMKELVSRYGLKKLSAGGHYGMDVVEAAMRQGIASVPDGDYRVVDFIDDDSITPEAIEIVMTVKVRGDSMEIDYSGTSRQPDGNVGTAWIESTRAIIGAKQILDPGTPVNSGTLRPVEAIMPPGSVVLVLPPSSCSNHNDVGCRVINLMTQAMAMAIPDRAIGCDSGHSALLTIGGVDQRSGHEGEPWATFSLPGGAWGGTWTSDGLSMCINSMGNCRSSVHEHAERENPIIVWQHEIMPDSAGVGEHRGGAGMVYTFSVQSETVVTLTGDRARAGAPGAQGGGRGMPFYAWRLSDGEESQVDVLELDGTDPIIGIYDDDGHPNPDGGVYGQGTSHKTGKIAQIRLNQGEGMRLVIGGGGGWGDPLNRDVDRVLRDVEDGIYTAPFVAAAFGVVVEGDSVDREATDALRARLADMRQAGEWQVPSACPPHWTGRANDMTEEASV